MFTRMLFLIVLVGAGIVVLTGAWPGSFAPSTHDAEPAFVPKSILLDAQVIGSGIDAPQLLEKALSKLDDDNAGWLRLQIRQSMHDGQADFTAHGTLERGPNHCARLEMEVVTSDMRSQYVIVSDGAMLAHVEKHFQAKPNAQVERLPTEPAAREALLCARGCGGPAPLIRLIRQHLRDGTLQTGVLGGAAVIQVKCEIDPAQVPAFASLRLTTLQACVHIDAKTLWPHRVTWLGSIKNQPLRPLLRVDYDEPRIGVALGDEDCMRMFSYNPDGSEVVTEITRP